MNILNILLNCHHIKLYYQTSELYHYLVFYDCLLAFFFVNKVEEEIEIEEVE